MDLKKALNNLPSYEPSDQLWSNIEQGMKASEQKSRLHRALHRLPEYEPKASVWEQIEAQLQTETKTTGRIVRLGIRRWAAAAAVALLIVTGFFVAKNAAENADNLAYETEVVDDALLAINWDEDEADFEAVIEMSKEKPFINAQPEVQQLRSELEELNDAREMLKEAIGEYGTNLDLINQLKEIELERSNLLQLISELV